MYPSAIRMDKTAEIKKNIISKIEDSTDMTFLEALQTLMEFSEKSTYDLSQEQQHSIEQGRSEISQGEFLNNDQVISELKEWLSQK